MRGSASFRRTRQSYRQGRPGASRQVRCDMWRAAAPREAHTRPRRVRRRVVERCPGAHGPSKAVNLKIDLAELHPIAASLGSDVPFFLYGGTALGMGRGEIVEPIEDFVEKHMLVVA